MIEIGIFSDLADGPTIQIQPPGFESRRFDQGLRLVRDFRGDDQSTPVVLMGYFNPIYSYGIDALSPTPSRRAPMADSRRYAAGGGGGVGHTGP